MHIATRELSRLERASLERHLLALDDEDRRLRFGIALSDQTIRDYVVRIDFERDAVFAAFDDALELVARSEERRGGEEC